MSVDETLNLIWPTAWIVAVRIPLHAATTPPTNIDEKCLATVEAFRQIQTHVVDLVIEEDRRFAQHITDSGLVTADADSRKRMAGVATYVDMPAQSNWVARKYLTIEAVHHWCPRLRFVKRMMTMLVPVGA